MNEERKILSKIEGVRKIGDTVEPQKTDTLRTDLHIKVLKSIDIRQKS